MEQRVNADGLPMVVQNIRYDFNEYTFEVFLFNDDWHRFDVGDVPRVGVGLVCKRLTPAQWDDVYAHYGEKMEAYLARKEQ